MIRLAKIQEIPQIVAITQACARDMMQQNIFQWNEHYPSKQIFLHDIKRNELYVLTKNNEIIGCVVLSSKMDKEYKLIAWLTPNDHNLYIHRLAIHPTFQHKGYAQELMNFAENFAKQNKYQSIRLDTFSKNPRNQNFYKQRGYVKVGSVHFLSQSPYPFYCYELVCKL